MMRRRRISPRHRAPSSSNHHAQPARLLAFEVLAANRTLAFNQRFFDPQTGVYAARDGGGGGGGDSDGSDANNNPTTANATQCGQGLALELGLPADAPSAAAASAALVALATAEGHLTTGMIRSASLGCVVRRLRVVVRAPAPPYALRAHL